MKARASSNTCQFSFGNLRIARLARWSRLTLLGLTATLLGLGSSLRADSYTIPIRAGCNLIANQLDHGSNTLNEVVPLVPDGCVLYKYDNTRDAWVISTYSAVTGSWADGDNITLAPGEGAFLCTPSSGFDLTFTGDPHTPVLPLPLGTGCAIVSRQTNAPGTYDTIVGAPPAAGATVYKFSATGGYVTYTYDEFDLAWTPAEPTTEVGEALWVCATGGSAAPTPILGYPTNKTVECGSGWTFDRPVATGPCGGTNVQIISVTTVTNSGPCPLIVTRTWRAIDNCGTLINWSQTVTIVDTTPPIIHCPGTITVQGCQEVPVNFDVIADDACCNDVKVVCSPASGSLFPPGITTVHCLATDCCGNTSTCEFLVIVRCPTNPCAVDRVLLNTGFDPISSTNLPLGAADPLWTIVADPDPGTTEPRPATTVPPYPGWQPALPNSDWISAYPGSFAPNGPYDFQTKFCLKPGYTNVLLKLCLRADDRADVFLNGNLIVSTPNPSFLTATPTCIIVSSVVNPAFFQIGPNVVLIRVYNVSGVVMGLNAVGSISGSGLALDNPDCCQPGGSICGHKFNDLNGDGKWQTNEPPMAGWTIQLSNGQTAVTDADGHYCFMNLAPGTYTLTEVMQAGWVQTAPPGGSYTITVGLAQSINAANFGNHESGQPCISIKCPTNIVVQCAGPGGTPVPFTVTASSSCGLAVTVVTMPPSPGPFPPGTTSVLCIATDAAGNTATCKFTVTVVDTTPPVVNCAPDKTVPWGFPWRFDLPQVHDDCCGDQFTVAPLNTVTSSICPMVITRTWLVTDCAGNTNTCSQTVTILSPPPCQVFNSGMTGTNGTIPLAVGAPDPNYLLVSWPSGSGSSSVVQTQLPGVWMPNSTTSQWIGPDVNTISDPPGVYHYQLQFVLCCSNLVHLAGRLVVDDSAGLYLNGNYVGMAASYAVWTPVNLTSWFVAGVNVLDIYVTNAVIWTGLKAELTVCVTPLTMACVADKTVECGLQWNFDPPTRINSCCGPDVTTTVLSTVVSNVSPCTTLYTRTWQVRDACGNSSTCSQTVTVSDTLPPVITCGTNKVVPCGAAWSFDTPIASDTCSGTTVSIVSTVTNSTSPFLITRTWQATDACGNSASCIQTVTVLGASGPFLCSTPTIIVLAAGTTNDNFATPEPAYPSAGLLARLAAAGIVNLKGFDDCRFNAYFAHSFSNLPSCIVEAKLHVRFKACGDYCQNDAMGLSFTLPSGANITGWGRYFGNGNPGGNGLFNTPWNAGTVGDITLDLSALPNPSGPPTDLLPKLNTYGFIDLVMQDDSSIDFAVLELKSCCCQQDIVVSTTQGACCAVVTYTPPNFNSCNQPVQVVFNPPSGTCFPVGTNLVQCTATDALGQVGRCFFKVIVRDTIPPTIIRCPTNVIACLGANGVGLMPNLIPQLLASDNCTPAALLMVSQFPPPGSLVGGGTVMFTVTDAAGNTTTCTQNILVRPCCDPPPAGMVLWLPFDELSGPTALNTAGGNNGTLMNTTSRNPSGYVNRSLCFDGVANYVKVPDYPAINPGTGDFSLDAWVKRSPNSGTAPRIIVDKRSSTYVGYSLCISFGNLLMQMGDTGGYTNFRDTGVVPADDQWHFVAVTVSRTQTNGGRFYIDGLPTGTFNPTGQPGNLNNVSAFQVGASPWSGNLPWMGCIDEVEMFRRALRAQEVRDLFHALSLGKCRPSCSLPDRTTFCLNQSVATIMARICNASAVPETYNFSFQGLPPGAGCNWPGPSSFSPAAGSLTVAPHSCVTFPVTIGLPPGMPCNLSACYQMMIAPVGTSELFACQGSIYRSCKLCFHVYTNVVVLPVGVTKRAQPFTVENTSSGPLDLSGARISIVGSDLLPDQDYVSLNGLPPGTPVELPPGTMLDAGAQLDIGFDVRFIEYLPGAGVYHPARGRY